MDNRHAHDYHLRHVIQRCANDCVIATAAMIAGITHEVATQRSPVPLGKRGMYPPEIVRILEAVTGVSWLRPQFGWWCPISRWSSNCCPIAVVIRQPWKRKPTHCVAEYSGFVHDPEYPSRWNMAGYPRRHWIVVAVYRPAVPERLQAVREYHERQHADLLATLRRRATYCI